MKKDIVQQKVEDLAIAVIPQEGDLWDVYIINFKQDPINDVMINSKGYGTIKNEEVKTSVFRHSFQTIGALQSQKIEPIPTDLFVLTNEYWVSFRHNQYLFDKKYVFIKGSIHPINFTLIPILNEKGVMIR